MFAFDDLDDDMEAECYECGAVTSGRRYCRFCADMFGDQVTFDGEPFRVGEFDLEDC